jgi:hypothetical protein
MMIPPIMAMPPVATLAAAFPVGVEAVELVEEVPDEEPVEVLVPDVVSVVERFELDPDPELGTGTTVVLATTVLVDEWASEAEVLVEAAVLLVYEGPVESFTVVVEEPEREPVAEVEAEPLAEDEEPPTMWKG